MISLFGNKKNQDIAISVGVHTIRALIFEPQQENMPPRGIKKIVTRIRPPHTSVHIVKTLHDLIFSLLKEIECIPEKITIGIGPEIAESKWERWEVELLNTKELFSKPHLQKYFHEFFKKYNDKNGTTLCYPISLEANGYLIDPAILAHQDPSFIRELVMHTITITFSDEISILLDGLQKMFGGITIELVPYAAALAESVSRATNTKDAFLIDIGDALTTLMFIQEGRLVQFASFPVGADNLTHRLMKKGKMSFSEAEDLKRQYIQKIIPKEEQTQISQIISEEVEEWKQQCAKGFEYFYHIGPIPQNCFLSGEGASLPEIRNSLASSDLSKSFSYVESFNFQILHGSRMYNGNSLQGMIQGPEDAKLASLVYYMLNHIPLF